MAVHESRAIGSIHTSSLRFVFRLSTSPVIPTFSTSDFGVLRAAHQLAVFMPHMHQHKTPVLPILATERLPNTLKYRMSDTPLQTTERDSLWRDKGTSDMHVLPFNSPASSRYRPVITTLLLVLCIPIFFYHIVPTVTSTTDDFMYILATRLRGPSSRAALCTSEVGSAYCCDLFLNAAPCVDECRKQHLNRVTYVITKEYDVCADKCLASYTAACKSGPRFKGS